MTKQELAADGGCFIWPVLGVYVGSVALWKCLFLPIDHKDTLGLPAHLQAFPAEEKDSI